MNEPTPPARSERRLDVNREMRCRECGAFGAVAVGDAWLCERCYAEKGSCCPEFGKDDLWKERLDGREER